MRCLRDDHRGVAGIEFALVAGVLCILLINGIEIARYAYTAMQVQNAAQIGAQSAWKACDPNKELPGNNQLPRSQQYHYDGDQEHPSGGRRQVARKLAQGGVLLSQQR